MAKKVVVPPEVTEAKLEMEVLVSKYKITGTSGLIVHAWSEKAKREILDKQMTAAIDRKKKEHEVKNPFECFVGSLYMSNPSKEYPVGRPFIPSIGIKNAICTAAIDTDVVKKSEMRRGLFIQEDRVWVEAPKLDETDYLEWDAKEKEKLVPYHKLGISMREDMVRIGNGIADVRFRGYFPKWSCEFTVEFNEKILSAEKVSKMIQLAGFHVGLFEWRPEKGGSFGRFMVSK